ncbi:hypothetical protein D3C76_1210550 [compost metagenome]
MIARGADAGIGVGFLAHQLGIFALLAHQLDEFLGPELRALIVVRDDLADRDAGFGDLAVDQEGRDARILSALDGAHGRVRPGIVEDDGLGAAGDGGVEKLGLLVRVVVMDQHQRLVAHFLGLRLGPHGLGLEEGVVMAGGDDRDQPLGRGREGRGRECGERNARNQCAAQNLHVLLPVVVSPAGLCRLCVLSRREAWRGKVILSTGMTC